MQEDDISDSSSSRTISNANEDDGDEEENEEETYDEENSHQQDDNESSDSTDSISSEDPNKPHVTEGKAQLSPNSQKAIFRQSIKEVAHEMEEEAAKAKKAEEDNQAKTPASRTPVKSPRVKTVAQKKRKLVLDEGSANEELSDPSPLKQRRTKKANDPLFVQQTEGDQASDREKTKANDGQESNKKQEEQTQQEHQVFRLNLKLVEIFLNTLVLHNSF